MKKPGWFIFLLTVISSGLNAQDYPASHIPLSGPKIINFLQASRYEKQHPIITPQHAIVQEEDRDENLKFKPLRIPAGAPVFQAHPSSQLKSLQNSPVPVKSWDGIADHAVLIPPDIQGASGINYIMETTNQEFDIYSKQGAMVAALSVYAFFGYTTFNAFFDPHIVYDPIRDRFIVCMDGQYTNGDGGLFLAVSQTGDPTGNWYVYSFDAAGNPHDFIDYPELGFNTKWVVLTANDFIDASDTLKVDLYVMNRDSLYMGKLGTVNEFIDTNAYTWVPAQTIDSTEGIEYLVQDANGNHSGTGYMQIATLTGTADAPVYNPGRAIGITSPWNENVALAPQQGSDHGFESGDTRVMNGVTLINGLLWFTHNVFLPLDTPTYSGVDWWQVNPVLNTLVQYGRIADTTGQISYYYPNILVNANNDALLGYCISSPGMYSSAAYSFRFSADAAGTMRNTYIYKNGLAPYYKTLGTQRNRWGDFTGSSVDPVDQSFWTFGQFAGVSNNWETEIAHIPDSANTCVTRAAFVNSPPVTCSVPYTVNFADQSQGASSYQWYFGDGATSVQQNPAHTYTQSGSYSVKLVVSDPVCGLDSITENGLVQLSDGNPTVIGQSICSGEEASLAAYGTGTLNWYATADTGSPSGTGNQFFTPPLYDTTTYYVQAQIRGAIDSAGPVDTTIGLGNYFTASNGHFIVFDCSVPQVLLSVDVYAQGGSYRTFSLNNSNDSTMETTTVYIPDGHHTVPLNFVVPAQDNMKLYINGYNNLFYNFSGTNYPYYSNDSTIIITNTNYRVAAVYYFLYNWKMQRTCFSARVPVQAVVLNPHVNFSYTNTSGNVVNFTANSAANTSYTWNFGDGNASFSMSPSHTYSSSGIYTVQLAETSINCTDTATGLIVVDTAGNSEWSELQSMLVSPDPAVGRITVKVGIKQPGSCELSIRNNLGQTVTRESVSLSAGENNLDIDLSAFATGIYYISLRNGKTIATRRFVKTE